jgi:putative aldouronate transport system substrate-binding protein
MLALALLLGCLPGWGGPALASEPVTLEIIRWGGGLPTPEEDIIKAELLKRLNVNIELVGYNDISNYINVLNTRIATGAFPDLFWVNQEILRSYSQKGLVLDLTDIYNDQLSTVRDWLGDSLRLGIVNKRHYGIPVPISFEYCLTYVRQDWLDNLGLELPTTLDRFSDVAVSFTNADPD